MIKKALYFFATFSLFSNNQYDLTIVGNVLNGDGIGSLPIIFSKMLQPEFKINLFYNKNNLWHNPKDIDLKEASKEDIGKVLLYTTTLKSDCMNLPDAKLNIAYSMLESTKIPDSWVDILNKKFDMVVVPDEFLVSVYKSSGVITPIFVLPLAMDLDSFLKLPIKKKQNRPFVFGVSANFIDRKNHELVLDAFIKAFGNSSSVKLILQGRYEHLGHQEKKIINRLKNKIKKRSLKNVVLIDKKLTSKEYIKFMNGLDCYVLISKGEGFSKTPREALALGIPCILSNNTAHKSMCQNSLKFIYPVKSEIIEKAKYDIFGDIDVGYQLNCSVDDVARGLKYVCSNYIRYMPYTKMAREYAAFYSYQNLKQLYSNLIKPHQIILGEFNEICEDKIVTNSKELYDIYSSLIITN